MLPLSDVNCEATLVIRGAPFRFGSQLRFQRITFLLDGQEIATEQAFGESTFLIDLGRKLSTTTTSKLEAVYPDATAPSYFGLDDDRILGFAWRSLEIYETLPRPERGFSAASDTNDIVSTRLYSWARREMLPWIVGPLNRVDSQFAYERLNNTMPWAALYHFNGGRVRLEPKPSTLHEDKISFGRVLQYLPFLQSVARRLSPECEGTICLSGADWIEGHYEVPIFMFQKLPGEPNLLLPDIEFVQQDFYEAETYVDKEKYLEKSSTAVFAGATTGGSITTEVAVGLSLPRLQAARHFENNIRVDFRLPHVVQCASEEAEIILKAKSFCIRPRLSWREQFRHRFLISIDGNGATCSRVAIALLSNSALLKYNSPHRLYYFEGLIPWIHYVPITSHSEIDAVLSMDLTEPAKFETIAQNGRAFACDYLTRSRAEEYTANLLSIYFAAVQDN